MNAQEKQDIEDLSKDTHGRISFVHTDDDIVMGNFNPYRLNSEIQFQNMERDKKTLSKILFYLSKYTGFQSYEDFHTVSNDLKKERDAGRRVDKDNFLLRREYKKLDSDMKRKLEKADIRLLINWLSLISIAIIGYGTKLGYERLYQYYQKDYLENNEAFIENVLRSEVLHSVLNPKQNGQCGICLYDIEHDEQAITHCRNQRGVISSEATPYHIRCLRENHEHNLNRSRDFLTSPCPSCRNPLISEEELTILRQNLKPTFPQYVLQKTIQEPISKLGRALAHRGQNLMDRFGRRHGTYLPVVTNEIEMMMHEN